MEGYIKLYRIFKQWEWYTEPNMVLFFIHCLLRVNHSEGNWKGYPIKKGEFISGRKQLATETGLSEQQIRTCIKKLESTNELTIKTTNKYSVFSLNSWEKYQLGKSINQQIPNEQPTINQQVTTNKNVKNVKNIYISMLSKKKLLKNLLMFLKWKSN